MRTPGTIYRAVVWTMLTTTMLAACTYWQVPFASPEQLIATEHPAAVRVQLRDGSRVVMLRPRIGTDSLVGVVARKPTSIPLADISQLALNRIDARKTAGLVGLVLGVGAVAYLAAVWAACRSGEC